MSLRSSPLPFARTGLTLCLVASALASMPEVRASGAAPPPSPTPAPSQAGSLAPLRRTLREFDRFLDHHPLLEDQLRLNPRLLTTSGFLSKNPELHAFLVANPNVVPGLQVYPRYFLYRALIRQANAPLSFHDVAIIKDLLQMEPALEPTLTKDPELIRDRKFLETHAEVRDFLIQHPELGHVFLTSTSAASPAR